MSDNHHFSAQTLESSSIDHYPDDRLCTVTQAAEILGLPTSWLYERTRKDAIPYHKLGKYIRFTASDLAEILSTCSRGPRTNESSNNQ
jgi:excisionase family DNA binding protein